MFPTFSIVVIAALLVIGHTACSPGSSTASDAREGLLCEQGACFAGLQDGGSHRQDSEAPDQGWSYGTDCPQVSPSSLPADSPRILIVGPIEQEGN